MINQNPIPEIKPTEIFTFIIKQDPTPVLI